MAADEHSYIVNHYIHSAKRFKKIIKLTSGNKWNKLE